MRVAPGAPRQALSSCNDPFSRIKKGRSVTVFQASGRHIRTGLTFFPLQSHPPAHITPFPQPKCTGCPPERTLQPSFKVQNIPRLPYPFRRSESSKRR